MNEQKLGIPAIHLYKIAIRRFTCIIVLLAILGSGLAQAGRLEVIVPSEKPLIKPYFTVFSGFHQPEDAAYDLVYSEPIVLYGGGFGLRSNRLGGEVDFRTGSLERSLIIDKYTRQFFLSMTEMQIRVYGMAHLGDFSIPCGLGAGLLTMTVDRGYFGIFDRFGGSGYNLSPFIGVEYQVTKGMIISLESEYSLGKTEFPGNENFNHLYDHIVNDGNFPPGNDDYWDTVGADFDQTFNNQGLYFGLKLIVMIPTFKGLS